MEKQLYAIFFSDYFWGTIVGLVLSIIGAYALGSIQSKQLKSEWTNNFIDLSIDIIRNLKSTIDQLAEARERSQAIHQDLLALIDAELAVFGRNREYSIRLSPELRGDLRKYITNIAIIRTRILGNLNQFNMCHNRAEEIESQNIEKDTISIRQEASKYLVQANKATDDLINLSREGNDLIRRLEKESTR
ncbi:hypothetical protein ACFOY8_24015 [Thalassospira xianhensis]|uniref:hypothetical protein n=1 Tax=Thalassospira xianhensis TaxID=478503 RepID=UPI0011BD4CA5|nr:hypothetical protein [Thalassospira xianhensis]